MSLNVLTFKTLKAIKPMDIKITGKDFLPMIQGGGYNILSGRGGVGKSMLALTSMIDYLIANQEKNGLGIFTEDGKIEINNRMWTVCKNKYKMTSLEYDELLERCLFMTVETLEPLQLIDRSQGIAKLSAVVNQLIQIIISRQIGFVVFDPLKYFHQQEENSNSEMKEVMSAFSKIGIDTGAVILVLHHSAKGTSGARGASCIEDDSRLAYSLSQRMKKNNDGTVEVDEDFKGLVHLSVQKDNYRAFNTNTGKLFEDESKRLIRLFPRNPAAIEYTYEEVNTYASMPKI